MTSSSHKVRFFFDVPVALTERTRLKSFIERIFKREKKALKSLIYVFTSDKKLLELNKKYLKHDYYTDILTFNLSDQSQVTGEIYISVDRVRDNAFKLKIPLSLELTRVIFHGALHLCGYSDKTADQKKKMRSREDHYLQLFHVKTG